MLDRNKRIELRMSLKGQRQYVQGGDMYAHADKAAKRHIGSACWVNELTIRKMAFADCDIIFSNLAATHHRVVATFTLGGCADCEGGVIVETDRPPIGRVELDEAHIVGPSEVTGNTISRHNRSRYEPIEEVVALTKHLHQILVPTSRGRWIFTKVNLTEPFDSSVEASYSVTVENVLASRVSASSLLSNGRKFGTITFIVMQS